MPAYPALLDPTVDNYKVMRESINSMITRLETIETSGVPAHTQDFSTITNTPTTLAGYGITDPVLLDGLVAGEDITSGTIDTARLDVGTTAGTVAAGDHLHPGVYNPTIGIDTDLAAAPAVSGRVIDTLTLTDGVIQGYTTRDLDFEDVGAAADGHTHTTADITDFVAQSVNDATITIGGTNGLTGGSSFTTNDATPQTINISHADTSTQASVNNAGNTVIQDITLDDYGHITAIGSTSLTATDVSALPIGGGTLTGNLNGTTCTFTGEITGLSFNATSDERLKNVFQLSSDMESASFIQAISYSFKNEEDGKLRIGYTAQSVEPVLPSAVSQGVDGFLKVDYIQVLVAKVAYLEAELQKLKA